MTEDRNWDEYDKQQLARELADQKYHCSCGGFKTGYPELYSLCPNCGAGIDEEED